MTDDRQRTLARIQRLASLASVPVLQHVPAWRSRGPEMPAELVGATIVAIGTPDDDDLVEGGGLVIDYIPAGYLESRRIVFAISELGMVLEYVGQRCG